MSPFHEKRTDRLLPPGVIRITAREGLLSVYISGDQIFSDSDRFSEERLASGLSQESTHYALASMSAKKPLWLQTGLMWLIASTEISATRITFADTAVALGHTRLPSLQKVLTQTAVMTAEEEALSCAFTHFCLYGYNSKNAQKFIAFVERLQAEPMSEKLFEEVFRMPLKKMERALTDYVHSFTVYRSIQLNGKLPPMPAVIVRNATQSEIARLKADALIAQGEPDSGLNVLRIAYWRGEREPEMLAVLAGLEERFGSIERSQKIVKALMALPTPPVRVLPVAAKLHYRELTASKAPGTKLTTAEAISILSLLGQTVKAGYNSEELCAFFSEVVLHSEGKPHASIGDFLAQAAKRYPNNNTIRDASLFAAAGG